MAEAVWGVGRRATTRRKARRRAGRSTGMASWGTGHRRGRGLEPAGMVTGHWESGKGETETGHWELPPGGKGTE